MKRLGKHPPFVVYLLHFDEPLAHAQHYLGMTDNLVERMRHHVHGAGAALVAAFAGIGQHPTLVRTWECGSRRQARHVEWVLKQCGKNSRLLCPLCSPTNKRYATVSDEWRMKGD